MMLNAIPTGETVFVDANIFIYAFAPEPTLGPPCQTFLERAECGEIRAVTSSLVLSNTAHRLMSLEACQQFGWPYANIATKLSRHPNEVRQLGRYRQAISDIVGAGIQVIAVEARDILAAASVSQQLGLLSNDGLIVAIMRQFRITTLASNDDGFDIVPAVQRFAPV